MLIKSTDCDSNLLIFPRVGAFDNLKWTYNGAFEQFFSLGRGGDLNKNFPKIQMPGRGGGWGGGGGGMLKLQFDWYIKPFVQE